MSAGIFITRHKNGKAVLFHRHSKVMIASTIEHDVIEWWWCLSYEVWFWIYDLVTLPWF